MATLGDTLRREAFGFITRKKEREPKKARPGNMLSGWFGKLSRQRLHQMSVVLIIVMISLVLSDFSQLFVRHWLAANLEQGHSTGNEMIGLRTLTLARPPETAVWTAILERNIFNSDGLVPEVSASGSEFNEDEAVPANLPMKLIATIVHADPEMSVATFEFEPALAAEFKNKRAFGIGDTLAGATILKVIRGKVFFREESSRNVVYLEIPRQNKLRFGDLSRVAEGIMSRGPGEFIVERSRLARDTSRMDILLQQARAEPEIDSGGRLTGFRLAYIQPGRVFEKIGLRQGDVIAGLNGEKLDDAKKGLELYSQLGTADRIDLEILRAGRREEITYTIR